MPMGESVLFCRQRRTSAASVNSNVSERSYEYEGAAAPHSDGLAGAASHMSWKAATLSLEALTHLRCPLMIKK